MIMGHGTLLLRIRRSDDAANGTASRRELMTTEPMACGVHLVGSVPLRSNEDVFRVAGSILGGRLRRVPDGETGERHYWIGWQVNVLRRQPEFELIPPTPDAYAPIPRFKLRTPAQTPTFGALGYADAAIASYAVFKRLQQEGAVPAHWRFQVSLPTPLAVVAAFIVPDDQAAIEPLYETRLLDELDAILDTIPHDELAIQWDIAVEIGILESVMPAYFQDRRAGILERLTRLGHRVPAKVELGYHLCYGDAEHRHFKQPEDLGKLVDLANVLAREVQRPLTWIHMPVPRDRADDGYFAPLHLLRLAPETELYLGLVHYTDGVEGTRQRLAAARRTIRDFGVATECGMGRRPPETIPALLAIHAAVAEPVV
jgi:hypothetical protein